MNDKNAQWVFADNFSGRQNSYTAFRLLFNLKERCQKLPVRISASDVYMLYVNGKYLGRGPVRSWKHRIGMDKYDIPGFLSEGPNTISALIHNYGIDIGAQEHTRAGFFFDGMSANQTLSTGSAEWEAVELDFWRQDSPRISLYGGFNEHVDMDRYNPDIWEKGADANLAWKNAEIIKDAEKIWTAYEERSIPFLDETYLPAPRLIAVKNGSSMIYDAGRIMSGTIELELETEMTQTVQISYADRLMIEDRIYSINRDGISDNPEENAKLELIPDHGGPSHSVDVLELKKGLNSWRGMFNLRGFQYVMLTFQEGLEKVSLKSLKFKEITYPVKEAALFNYDDETLNKIWKASLTTARLCMSETFMDNPSRERQQYGGDGYFQSLYAAYYFGDTKLWLQFLRQFSLGMNKNKAFQSGGPWPWNQIIPAWTLLWIESIYEYFKYTGEESIFKELSPKIIDALEWFENFETQDGRLEVREIFDYTGGKASEVVWNYIDWQGVDGQLKGEDAKLTLDCIYCSVLESASCILEKENPVVSQRCKEKSARLKSSLEETFKNESNICEHALCAGFLAGVINNMDSVAEKTKDASFESDILFIFFFFKALEKADKLEELLTAIKSIFGEMLEDGSSTFYESRYALQAKSRALCQGVGAAPGYFLLRAFSGLRDIDASSKTITTAEPLADSAENTKAIIPCVGGNIESGAENGECFSKAPPNWTFRRKGATA